MLASIQHYNPTHVQGVDFHGFVEGGGEGYSPLLEIFQHNSNV